jgi:hypothetical protein
MRTITAAQQRVLDSGVQGEHVRVRVKDGGGTFRDLTTWPGFNAVKQVSIKAAINDPHMTCDVALARELFDLSFSPFVEDSALNRNFDPGASFTALLAVTREFKVDVAIVEMDSQPESGDWMEIFHGRIDEIDAARGPEVTITGRDMGGRLAQQYIKRERVYAFATDGGMVSLRIWAPEMAVTSGEYVIPANRGAANGDTPAAPGYNKFFKCDTTGTTGTSEPEWTTGANQNDGTARWDYIGAPTLTGFAVETVIQKILDDNKLSGDPTVTLDVPVSPSWTVTEFQQQRGFTLDAVRALATQIGWDLRYMWKESSSAFVFRLYEPDRDASVAMHTFGADDYEPMRKLGMNIAVIRNSVLVIYKDRADLWPDGTPRRKEITATDPTSITAFGELWSELQEGENGNIDTEAEAERLAAAFISDCAWPTAEASVPIVRGFPWVELNDYYEFSPDGIRSSTALKLAVTGWQHDFQNGEMKTTLQLRGQPTAGHHVHLDKEYRPNKPKKEWVHRFQNFAAPVSVNPHFREIVGGIFLDFKFPENTKKEELLAQYEVHVSDTDGFDPTDDTLVAVVNGTSQSIPYQNPGGDYYGCVVPRWFNAGQLVRGQPTKRQPFTAGRASAGHLVGEVIYGGLPLNGGFETKTNPAADALPDHWTLIFGAMTEHVTTVEDSDGAFSGHRFLQFATFSIPDPENQVVVSSAQPIVTQEELYRLSVRRKNDSGTGTWTVAINWLDDAKDFLSSDALNIDVTDKTGTWVYDEAYFGAPLGAKFAELSITSGVTDAASAWKVDDVRFEPVGTGGPGEHGWYEVGDTTNFTDNYESIPDFENSWVNYGTDTLAGFRRDRNGRVELKGLVKDGTIGDPIFTLPPSFRPPYDRRFPVMSNNALGGVWVYTDGTVVAEIGSNAWVDLGGISFTVGFGD